MNWLCILVGHSCTGKTTLIRILANLLGVNLVEFSVNNATDTSDLLGGFEKVKHTKSQVMSTYDHLKAVYVSNLIQCDKAEAKLALMQNYLAFTFEAKQMLKVDLEESAESTMAVLSLFKKNLDTLKKFNIKGIITAQLLGKWHTKN